MATEYHTPSNAPNSFAAPGQLQLFKITISAVHPATGKFACVAFGLITAGGGEARARGVEVAQLVWPPADDWEQHSAGAEIVPEVKVKFHPRAFG